MANPLVDLTTAADAAVYLSEAGLTAPADLEAIITGVSAEMQSYANRNFVSQPYSQVLNGLGGDRLVLRNTPITAVSSLAIDGVAIPAAASPTGAGFVFDELVVYLRGYSFCRGVQNVAISYSAGYSPVPMDLQRAACEGVAAVVAAIDTGDPRAIELKAGGSAIRFARDSGELAAICLTPNVTSVLNQRMRTAPI